MGMCWVPQCSHKGEEEHCRMFTMPADVTHLNKWLRLIRRGNMAQCNRETRICSCHFKDGDKSNGPSIFPWNKEKVFNFVTPEKKRRRASAVRPSNFDLCINNKADQMCDDKHDEGQNERQRAVGVARTLIEPSNCNNVVSEMICDDKLDNQVQEDKRQGAASVAGNLNEDCDFNNQVTNVQVDNIQDDNLTTQQEDNREGEVAKLLEEIANLKREVARLNGKLLLGSGVLHEAENRVLREEVDRLRNALKGDKEVFLFRKISENNKLIAHYTGLPNKETFVALLKLFDGVDIHYQRGWKVKKLDKENQLFLTLIKLRRNLSNDDLAMRFKIDSTTVSNIFKSWLMALHHVVFKTLMATVPPREKNLCNLPACFKAYPSTRMIIDCTEVTSACPKLLSDQNRMFSSYKHKITCKGLVGLVPSGALVFVSKLYPGSTSDKKIVIDSKALDCLVPGDSIMADKGFLIADILPDGVTFNIPPVKDIPQFTEEQVEKGKRISRAIIHVERAISRLKRFQILQYIPHFVRKYASEIFQVCAGLVNFQNGLLKECADSDNETDCED